MPSDPAELYHFIAGLVDYGYPSWTGPPSQACGQGRLPVEFGRGGPPAAQTMLRLARHERRPKWRPMRAPGRSLLASRAALRGDHRSRR